MRRKILSLTLSLSLFFQYSGFAQTLNLANYLSQSPNPLISADRFRPIQLKYFSYEPGTSDFKILLDKGDQKNLSDIQAKNEANKLLTYFQIGLTLPNEKFWVNLRPDAQDQIIDPELEKTDIGKILLEADLQLKKDTASWTSPQTKEGKEYWDKMYKRAGELLGSENVTIPTVTRPWIVPGEIILKASDSSAYIYKANLKVMLEEDYLKSTANPITQTDHSFSDPRLKELNQYSTQLIRELIIPKLTKRINSSKDYVNLRQVYFSLILARWFKETFGDHQPPVSDRQPQDNSYINLINSHNLTNLNSKQAWDKTDYFKAYQKSFKQGEYRLSEPVYTPAGQVIRRYMSGGVNIMSGSPLEWSGRFLGNIKEFYWFAKLMSKTMVALFVRGNKGDAAKAMEEFNDNFIPDLSPMDQNILHAGLTNISDGSIVMEKVKDAIDDFYDPDPAWDFPDGVKKFVRRFEENQDKVKFLNEKIKSALKNRLSEEETGVLLTTLKTYYAALARQITSRFEEANYSAEHFSAIQRLIESPKFKDTVLGKKYASARNKREFIKNIISFNILNEEAEIEWFYILSHVWREISGKTSHPGYITSEEAEKISDEYMNEMRKYVSLLKDLIAQDYYYFNEYTISRTEDLLKNDKTKEASAEALRAISALHYTYTLRYSKWLKTYSFYYSKRIRFSDYSNEIGELADEIKESLSDLPLFPKESHTLPRKKEQNTWEAAKRSLNAVDEALRILEKKKIIFELLEELPDAMIYLYARAVTTEEKVQLNKFKEEIRNFIDNGMGFRWSDMNEVERCLTKGEARNIMLATVKIALMYAKEAGVDSKEFHKWKNKTRTLVKQFSTSSSALEKGNAAVGSPLNLEGIKLEMKIVIEKEQLAQKGIPRIDDNPSYYSLSKIATKIKLTRNTKEDISNWEDIQKWLTQMVRYESEINRFMSNYKRKGILTASDKKEMDGYFMSNNLISAANKLSELAGGDTEMRWAFIHLEEDIHWFMLSGIAREDSKSALSRIQQIIDKRSASTQRQITLGTGSSALTITENPETLGGIDLRQMNILVQPQGEFSGLDLTLPVLSSSAIEAMDLDKELASIQQMVSSGLIPSGQRLKEFLAACFAKGKIEEKADSLVLCIADTFELQQMEAEESSLIYKEALVIADTRRYVLKKG